MIAPPYLVATDEASVPCIDMTGSCMAVAQDEPSTTTCFLLSVSSPLTRRNAEEVVAIEPMWPRHSLQLETSLGSCLSTVSDPGTSVAGCTASCLGTRGTKFTTPRSKSRVP
jgi:hypothetical protein